MTLESLLKRTMIAWHSVLHVPFLTRKCAPRRHRIPGLRRMITIMQWAIIVAILVLSVSETSANPVNAIVVGGSSGMGKAAALAVLQRGGRIMLVSRSEDKLLRAKSELKNKVPEADIEIRSCDVSDEEQVVTLANLIDSNVWDSLIVSAAGMAPHGPMLSLPTSDTRAIMQSKVWTAYYCAKHLSPKLRDKGAVIFVAGILNRRPGLNCSPLAMANGALEGLTRSLALEWGPRLRVNCLSPGFCDTERFNHMDADRKERMLANTAASLPLQRVGQPEDMGEAIFYLLSATFCTGIVLDVDGGHGIRQYANPTTDPMRTTM